MTTEKPGLVIHGLWTSMRFLTEQIIYLLNIPPLVCAFGSSSDVQSLKIGTELGYNTIAPIMTVEERRNVGAHVSKVLGREELAARPTW